MALTLYRSLVALPEAKTATPNHFVPHKQLKTDQRIMYARKSPLYNENPACSDGKCPFLLTPK